MKKRLICLFLSLIMLLSVCLTGCSNETEDPGVSEKASEDAETLSMYLMSEAPVSQETAKRIEDAVNEITETKFKTRMKLYFYTEEEYYAKLEAAFEARANAKPAPEASEDEDAENQQSTNGALIVYPEIPDYQVDLFYMGGMERYFDYKEKGLLANMDASLSTASKKLTEYISTSYFNALRASSGSVYAIPSNRAIGQYTYLLFNKEVLQTLYRSPTGVTSLTDEKCRELLDAVKNSDTLKDKYVPLWTNVSDMETLITNLQFIGADENGAFSDSFSVVGNFYGSSDILTTSSTQHAMVSNLFDNEKFVSALRTLKMYETDGYYGAAGSELDFAVGVVQGGAELAERYGDDYEMVVIETPRMSTEDLYGHMFSVCNYSANIERSMEILTYLNTNEEFRNLLLYGVEGEDYHLIDTGVAKDEFGNTYKVVKRSSQNYMMAPEKTGNTFITYPLQKDDVIYSIHEYGVQQNKAVKTSLTLGFSLVYDEESGAYVKTEGMQALRTLSAEILADYRAVTDSKEAFDAFITASKEKIAANADVSAMILPVENHPADTCGGVCGSLLCYHKAWLKQNGVAAAG